MRQTIAMDKILIVGNGLTANLIPEYQHKAMMRKIKEDVPLLFDKADKLFAPFRKKVDSVQYSAVSWGYSGDGFCGEAGFGGPITDRPYNRELLSHIEGQLQRLGFNDTQTISTLLFQTYGLIYETQNDEISNVESLLKIIALFCQRGDFTKENQVELKQVANRIYYNNGKCGKGALDKSKVEQLKGWLSAYKMIFTTNYDCVLDEVLQTDEVKHLHGGFFYKKQDKLKRSSTLLSPDEACLIWGISGEEKEEEMKVGGGFTFPIHFPFESPMTIFQTYLSQLQNADVERIDIFGYSGENDQHINRAIAENTSIREIHYYCAPIKVSDPVEKFEVTSRFSIKMPKKLVLKSWNTIWNILDHN